MLWRWVALVLIIGSSVDALTWTNRVFAQAAPSVDAFALLAKAIPLNGFEIRIDDVSAGDLFIGMAVDGTLTSVTQWNVVRYYRTAAGAVTRARFKGGISWDSRANAGNWP